MTTPNTSAINKNFNVDDVLTDLTVEEKVQLLCGLDAWHLHGIERFNIPPITLTDGPHGVRLTAEATLSENTEQATVFPVEAAMAATWNTELIHDAAAAIGREAQSLGVSVILGPGLNGKRSPLGGRNFEYFSEDPYLTGTVASAYVNGIQSEGVGACIKHFVGNEQETRRFLIDAEIDERTLQEIYLAPFAHAITNASPWTVMGAYNGVNGEFACQNPDILQRLLRDGLGFEGLVMSDWSAVQNKVAAHQAGLDLEMPGPALRDEELMSAVKSGAIPEADLNARVSQVLNLIKRSLQARKDVTVDWDSHHEVAVQVAQESLVLLKNNGGNHPPRLPLTPRKPLVLIGEFATEPRFQGGGSSHMKPRNLSAPLDAIQARYPLATDVDYVAGYTDTSVSAAQLQEAITAAGDAEQVVILTGTTDSMESEGFDRTNMQLAPDHVMLIQAVAVVNPHVVVVIESGSAIDTRAFEDQVPAIMQGWLTGEGNGEALARVLFGEVSPSGKLSETFPLQLEHNPTFETFPGSKAQVTYHEGLFVGYRYYDTKALPVQYPFGHGLSYTRFALSDLQVSVHPFGKGATVNVQVRNTGRQAGAEVVQVYLHDEVSTWRRPEQELKGFTKVFLAPGESKTVSIALDERAFAYYVPHLKQFAVESGRFEVRVGSSSRYTPLREWVTIESDTEVRILPTLEDPLDEWLADQRTAPVMEAVLQDLGFVEGHPMYQIVLGFPVPQLLKFIPWMGHDEATAERVRERLAGALAKYV